MTAVDTPQLAEGSSFTFVLWYPAKNSRVQKGEEQMKLMKTAVKVQDGNRDITIPEIDIHGLRRQHVNSYRS